MRFRQSAAMVALVLALGGCETESEVDGTAAGSEERQAEGDVQPANAQAAQSVEEKIFRKGTGDDRCAVLTLDDVAAATGVPASAIEQRPISGCIYAWDEGDGYPEGSVFLSSVRVHDTLDRAKSSFARSTRDVTAEEVGTAKTQGQAELEEKANEGEISERDAEIGSEIVGTMPERDFTHQMLDGVGNEAALEGRSVQIRYGNITIHFGAQMDNRDQLDPKLATELGRRIVSNLDKM